jgi:hypothetical protein
MLLHAIKLENSVPTRICSRDPWQHMLARQCQLESVVRNLPFIDSWQWRLQAISTFSQLFYFENMPLLPTQAVPHMWAMVKTTLRGAAICRPWATTIAIVTSAGDFLHMVVPAKLPASTGSDLTPPLFFWAQAGGWEIALHGVIAHPV